MLDTSARSNDRSINNTDIRVGAAEYLAVILVIIGLWLYFAWKPVLWLLGVVADDGFYYLEVARHLAASGASTFDGINVTNGYHPAWMAITTLCAMIVSDREALLRTV